MYNTLKEAYIVGRNRFKAKYIYPITRRSDREKLKNKTFSIISDNCWGGQIYQELGIQYNTPFVGLFVYSPDYLKLLENLEYYLNLDLKFTNESKYGKFTYPIGMLEDIEIHFLHYSSESDAYEKWTKRKKRINFNNLFVKMNDADLCTDELMYKFDTLEYNKVFFSSQNNKKLKSLVFFENLKKYPYIKNGRDMKYYRQYFDVVEWLNSKNVER